MVESTGDPFFQDKRTRLKAEREARGLSIAELARLAWVNASELSKVERGRVTPYEKQARRIADAVGWDGELKELFEPTDGRGRTQEHEFGTKEQ